MEYPQPELNTATRKLDGIAEGMKSYPEPSIPVVFPGGMQNMPGNHALSLSNVSKPYPPVVALVSLVEAPPICLTRGLFFFFFFHSPFLTSPPRSKKKKTES